MGVSGRELIFHQSSNIRNQTNAVGKIICFPLLPMSVLLHVYPESGEEPIKHISRRHWFSPLLSVVRKFFQVWKSIWKTLVRVLKFKSTLESRNTIVEPSNQDLKKFKISCLTQHISHEGSEVRTSAPFIDTQDGLLFFTSKGSPHISVLFQWQVISQIPIQTEEFSFQKT